MTGERGSGTVLAAGLVAVIATLLLAGLLVAAVAVAGQRARTAADLAALAGAGEAVTGADEVRVCEVARQVAARNGAGTVACRTGARSMGAFRDTGSGVLPSTAVEVVVSREVGGTRWVVTARARAGGVVPEG